MKTQFKVIPILALVLLSFAAQAQNTTHRSNFSVNVAESTLGLLWNSIEMDVTEIEGFESLSLDAKRRPALQMNYDHAIAKWFSIGVGSSTQRFQVLAEAVPVSAENEPTITRKAQLDIQRTNVAIRPLFHYVNKNRVDLYSGFRVGYTFYTGKAKLMQEGDQKLQAEVAGLLPELSGIALQVIPFGARFYITENLGLNAEFGIGSPHVVAAGVNYRF